MTAGGRRHGLGGAGGAGRADVCLSFSGRVAVAGTGRGYVRYHAVCSVMIFAVWHGAWWLDWMGGWVVVWWTDRFKH